MRPNGETGMPNAYIKCIVTFRRWCWWQNIVVGNTCRFVRRRRSWGLSELRNLNYIGRWWRLMDFLSHSLGSNLRLCNQLISLFYINEIRQLERGVLLFFFLFRFQSTHYVPCMFTSVQTEMKWFAWVYWMKSFVSNAFTINICTSSVFSSYVRVQTFQFTSTFYQGNDFINNIVPDNSHLRTVHSSKYLQLSADFI